MVCGRVSNLLSAYLDRELTGADMLAVRRHLSDCPACRAEFEALGQVRRLLGALPTVEPRAGSQDRFLRDALLKDGVASHRTVRRQALQTAGIWPVARPRTPWVLWTGAACAALAASLLVTGLSRPKPPDAVVAMIRPELDNGETGSMIDDRAAAYLWRGERGQRFEAAPSWDWKSEPGYQLVGLRQER